MNEQLDLEHIREKLEDERVRLAALIAERQEQNRHGSRINPDRSDLAKDYDLLQRRLALDEKTVYMLEQVESALKRIEAGNYGYCVNCGKPINPARLEALPHAQLCISCKEKQR